MLWLRGHNGSGKTTLLRVLAGLSQPDAGELSWGRASEQDGPERPVYIGHLNAMKEDLTVCESLQFVAGLHGRDDSRESAWGALRLLGMHHRRHAMVRTLSQGQRRRAALARLALEEKPGMWLLDEPFDALDAAGVAVVNQLLKGHLARGGGVVLTSHLALEATGPLVTELTLDQGVAA